MGATAAGRDCHSRSHHRLSGAHFRLVLDYETGDPARPGSASRRGAHLGQRDRSDLCAASELGADGCHGGDRARVWVVGRCRGRVWHCCNADDDHHRVAPVCGDDRGVALVDASGTRRGGDVPVDRRLLLRRQRAEGDAGRLGHAGCCGTALHVDDNVEDGTAAGRRAADCARRPT